jgi:hypothetical protein
LGTASCATQVRVPLAVPLPSVGGSRPATPQGFELIGEFGDGVWGQEQQRAEMIGLGLGIAARDRIEVSASFYQSTRTVRDGYGEAHQGEGTDGVRGKIRLIDAAGGRMSIGVHMALMTSARSRSDVQDERLNMWDVAVPAELYLRGDSAPDTRWGVYAGPRLTRQVFEDRLTGRTSRGSLKAGFAGVAARWRSFAITGELNLARTADMGFGPVSTGRQWLLLPMAGVRAMLPIGG